MPSQLNRDGIFGGEDGTTINANSQFAKIPQKTQKLILISILTSTYKLTLFCFSL